MMLISFCEKLKVTDDIGWMDFTTSEEIHPEARDTQKKPELFSRLVSSVPMVSDTVWERGKPFAHSPYMKDQLTFLPCS